MKVKLKCKNCQKEMMIYSSTAKNKKFCSRSCQKEYSKITLKCECCDKEFTSHKSSKRKYCSPECANKIIAENKKKKVKLICEICGKEYEVIKHRENKSKTCSRECAQKYAARQQETNRVKLTCLNCKKEYELVESHSPSSKFCSIECKAEYQKLSLLGKGNPNFGNYKYTAEQYQEWMDYRNAVRTRSYREYKKYKNKINPFNLKLGRWTYHLDHKYSIHDGFHNGIPISVISNWKNLQILTCKENLKKNIKSSISINELLKAA